jgi:exopolyphosphatase/pppGpp-phosphohydrolase
MRLGVLDVGSNTVHLHVVDANDVADLEGVRLESAAAVAGNGDLRAGAGRKITDGAR